MVGWKGRKGNKEKKEIRKKGNKENRRISTLLLFYFLALHSSILYLILPIVALLYCTETIVL